MKHNDHSRLILGGAAALFLGATAFAQSTPATPPPAAKPPAFKNLKIFPAEIPRERLIEIMQGYTVSLGVKCTFCHVGEEGKRETMDFASDANKHKDVARMMMAMTRRINEQDFAVKDVTKLKVTCYTCHRGSPHPLTAALDPKAPPPPSHH